MTGRTPDIQRLLAHLDCWLPRLAQDRRLLPSLESSFETLYSLASDDEEQLRSAHEHVVDLAETSVTLAVWPRLMKLALSTGEPAPAKQALRAVLDAAPAYDALVVTLESGRILLAAEGGHEAWAFLTQVDALDKLRRALPVSDLQRDGPLLSHGCSLFLRLAARSGDWERFESFKKYASTIWPEASPSWLKLGLADVESELLRSRHAVALEWIALWGEKIRGVDRAIMLCLQLHALVALGAARDPATQEVLQQFLALEKCASEPQGDLQDARAHVGRLAASDRELARIFKSARSDSRPLPSGDLLRAEDLFEQETMAGRDANPSRRASSLQSILARLEELLVSDAHRQDPVLVLRLRLMWCRLVVELGLDRSYDACETILDRLIEKARALQMPELRMHAHDLRGILRARSESPDWEGMLNDTAAASDIAMRLLVKNSVSIGGERRPRRSHLEQLLPVFDRVIENHVTGALAIRLASDFRADEIDPFDETLKERQNIHGSWVRFGRTVHAYVERAQALALDDARTARSSEAGCVPSAIPLQKPRVVIDELRARLSPTDAVLQYFLVGRYSVTFAYGARFFWWNIDVTEAPQSAEEFATGLLESLRAWVHGEAASADPEPAARLRRLMLPSELAAVVAKSRTRHLRFVPHGVLYRVPFGRLEFEGASVASRFSTSLHPTADIAALGSVDTRLALVRPIALGHVVGVDLEARGPKQGPRPVPCAAAERHALQVGAGRVGVIARPTTLAAWEDSRENVLARLAHFAALHFTCHGRKGSPLKPGGGIVLGDGIDGELDMLAIAKLPLSKCSLVVLQSCWTGWMEHTRSNPVQGIPQAFCDARAGAVIAPLTDVPMALAPIFSEVFYRALRFCSAELALKRTMDLLFRFGRVLVSKNAEALAAYATLGFDFRRVDYRYTGKTGIRIGGWPSRLLGRLSFWFYERGLARALDNPLSPATVEK